MEKYIIALDLDGTTIPGLYDISEYTIKVFKKINELGHKVIITTGRPYRSSFFVYDKMGLDTFMINYNGAYIHHPLTKEVLLNDCLDRNSCVDIVENTKGLYSNIFFESYDSIYTNHDDEYVYPLMHHNELSKIYEGNLKEILPSFIHGSLILAKDGHGKEICDYVNNHTTLKARMWSWSVYNEIVELYTTKNDKSISFDMVRNYYKIDNNHVIAFGDSMNDVDIFKNSKISVCPSNACATIKSLATIVLPTSVNEDAIAKWANDFFSLGIEYDN